MRQFFSNQAREAVAGRVERASRRLPATSWLRRTARKRNRSSQFRTSTAPGQRRAASVDRSTSFTIASPRQSGRRRQHQPMDRLGHVDPQHQNGHGGQPQCQHATNRQDGLAARRAIFRPAEDQPVDMEEDADERDRDKQRQQPDDNIVPVRQASFENGELAQNTASGGARRWPGRQTARPPRQWAKSGSGPARRQSRGFQPPEPPPQPPENRTPW